MQQLEIVTKNTNIPLAEVWVNFLKADLWSAKSDETKLREMQKDFEIDAFSTPLSCLQYFVQHRIAKSLMDNTRNSQFLHTIIDQKCIANENTKILLRALSRIEHILVLQNNPKNVSEISKLIEEVDQIWLRPESSAVILQKYFTVKEEYQKK